MKQIFGWIYGLVILVLVVVGIWVGFQIFLLLLFLFLIFLVLSRLRHWFMYRGSRAYRTRNTPNYGEKVKQIKDNEKTEE